MKTYMFVALTLAFYAQPLPVQESSDKERQIQGQLKEQVDPWAPFRPLVGKWKGQKTGMGGDATQSVEWKFILGDQFLHCQTVSKGEGDPHEDFGVLSYDKARKRFVYRAFFSEGFVNQYVAKISNDGKLIELVTEAVENGPPGLRAKEIIKIDSGRMHQELHLASGDKPFKKCVSADLKKQTR